MNKRYELTDEQSQVVEPILPKCTAKTGRRSGDPREMLNGIIRILRSGAPWRDIPERYGPWRTVYDYYWRWRNNGTFDRICSALQIRLDREGRIDWDHLWCIDGSLVRAARAGAGASRKASPSTRKSPPTTLWAAREADGAANSIWLLTAEACPWQSKSRPGNGTNRRRPKR